MYTPPYFRGHGYASICVADLPQRLLAENIHFVGLFADSQNPISCDIYHKLGFRNVCTIADYKFARQA